MTWEYRRVTYGWHTSKWEGHTDDIRVHTSHIQMACEWHANDISNFKSHKRFGAFRSKIIFSKLFVVLGGCKWLLATRLFRFPYFLLEYSYVQLQGLKTWIICKERRIISRSHVKLYFFLSVVDKIFCILSSVKIYLVSICSFKQRDYA